MKYRGIIKCNVCDEELNRSKEPVFEREKAWCERQAIFNCQPNCEHAKEQKEQKHGMCFDITVEWEPWELGELYEEKRLLSHIKRLSLEQLERLGEINAKIDEFSKEAAS